MTIEVDDEIGCKYPVTSIEKTDPPPGEEGNDHVKALVPALEKLGVTDFERYINTHHSAEPQTKDMLWEAVGR